MNIYMPMSTTIRHNKIINEFVAKIYSFTDRKDIDVLTSDCALVHWGYKNKVSHIISLVNITELDDIEDFQQDVINDLEYVQPDFLFFKDNPYVCNDRDTRTAGCPDLIVEIWSNDNTKAEKEFKRNLYASHGLTEHWYIDQKSNDIACFFGGDKLKDQSLTNVLKTQKGIEFDLRYLAI